MVLRCRGHNFRLLVDWRGVCFFCESVLLESDRLVAELGLLWYLCLILNVSEVFADLADSFECELARNVVDALEATVIVVTQFGDLVEAMIAYSFDKALIVLLAFPSFRHE